VKDVLMEISSIKMGMKYEIWARQQVKQNGLGISVVEKGKRREHRKTHLLGESRREKGLKVLEGDTQIKWR
jgi:hypothetical protein